MRLRHTSIRTRVFLLVLVPLVATIGIYGYAVANQLSTAVGLANAGKVSGATIDPVSQSAQALVAERDAAVYYLVIPSSQAMAALQKQEAVTNAAARVVTSVSKSGPVTANATPLEKSAAARFVRDLGTLRALRGEVASRGIGTTAAINAYAAILNDGVTVAEQGLQEEYMSQSLATTARAEVQLYTAAMLATQENDIYSAALAQGHMTPAAGAEFAQLAGLRRYLVHDAMPQLDSEASGLMHHYVPASLAASLTSQENMIISANPRAATPPVPLSTWQQTVSGYAKNMVVVMTKSPAWIQSQVVSSARSALTTLIIAASAGLLAVILSVIFSLLMGRRLVRRLTAVRQSALELARVRLPGVMARLRSGEPVDVDEEAPQAVSGVDEIDQVRQAFNAVHRTAVQAAVDESKLRRGISDVFRNLARRNQALLHRQLGLLDGMERRAEEPEQLEDLFRIDHLTTRMRRHAEGLIILSGDSPGRSWSQPVPFIDVLRAAVAEVEDYTRIQVDVRTRAALAGYAVADTIHLLAELIENATVFSPPTTEVRVHGELVGRGFAIEVEDRGLGLSEDQLAEINHDLAEVPAFDLAGTDRLGLFITARLAHRQDIRVTLRSSPFGGTTAIVIIPMNLVVPDDTPTGPIAMPGRALEPARQPALGAGSDYHGYAGNGHVGNGNGHAGNGNGHAGNVNGHAGNGNGYEVNGVPSELWTPRHSAGDSAESGWFARPYADSPPAPEPVQPGAVQYGAVQHGAEQHGAEQHGAEQHGYSAGLPDGGLPVRVPQASLAPQLREPAATGAADAGFDAPPASADAVRNTMSALQRGFDLGRHASEGG
jgi:signal transduction histidine kinase